MSQAVCVGNSSVDLYQFDLAKVGIVIPGVLNF